ncbi:MAG: methyltransferase domain-containing protein [Candidatus Sulfotelmatobacter sp.]
MKNAKTREQALRDGRERLYPSLTDPSWLVLRRRREVFSKWLVRLKQGKLDVLDVGGRLQPYRPLLEGRLRRYIAIDLQSTPLIDIVGRGELLPLRSGEFDLVICTQVLEYSRDPRLVIAEIHRVLKPDAVLLLSSPAALPRTAEEECWRFLPAGMRQLLAAFREVEVVPEGNSVTGFFRTANVCLDMFARYPLVRRIFRITLCPAMNLAGAMLAVLSGSRNDQFAVNYSVWARR